MQALIGIPALLLIAWALSENRRVVPWRVIVAGLILQLALALALHLPPVRAGLSALNAVVGALAAATEAGTGFVFGWLGSSGEPPFVQRPGTSSFVLAFRALPLVLLVSALSALFYHWRILPAVVRGFAWCLRRTLGVGGTAGVSTAANVFVGMVEAPLLVRPYLAAASRSDLFVIMTAGMATIAGTVMVLYAGFLTGVVADPIGQLLTASVMNAPAAIIMARLMVPGESAAGEGAVEMRGLYAGPMDAVTRGTADGLTLLLNIAAMLIVLVALVALVNAGLGLLPDLGGAPVTAQRLLGYVMAPVAWAIGVPWAEAPAAGALLGTKVVLNELIAYLDLSRLPAGALSDHSRVIVTYALCGFANFGSLGIMIGGMGAMAPDRRGEIVALGLRAILAGTLATCLTGALAGLLARAG